MLRKRNLDYDTSLTDLLIGYISNGLKEILWDKWSLAKPFQIWFFTTAKSPPFNHLWQLLLNFKNYLNCLEMSWTGKEIVSWVAGPWSDTLGHKRDPEGWLKWGPREVGVWYFLWNIQFNIQSSEQRWGKKTPVIHPNTYVSLSIYGWKIGTSRH